MNEELADTESQSPPEGKAGLLERIESSRAPLEKTIKQMSLAQIEAPGAGSGWSAKDHFAHLAAWEVCLTAMLTRNPPLAAMNVEVSTYVRGIDAINEALYQRNKERTAEAVLADFERSHTGLLVVLRSMSDADLLRPYTDFQPPAPGIDGTQPIQTFIAQNTYEHYAEHYATIQALSG